MDEHLAYHLLSKYPWMPQLLCHPWTIHEWTPWLPPSVQVSVDATVTVPSMDHPWMNTLPTTFCQSIRRCHSYCAINVPSIDGHLGCHLLSKYPWMPQLLCHQCTIHRRIEDAFFQYAILRAASWHPDDFCLCDLPLHGNTTATIENMTCVYHGAFMRKYAGRFNYRHVRLQ